MKANRDSSKLTESRFGFLLILPAMLLLLIMLLYPILNSVYMSLTDMSAMSPKTHFIGFDNYKYFLTRPEFWDVCGNTLVLLVFGTLLPFLIGFAWALVLNHGFRGAEFLRGVTLVAWIIPGTCIAFIWMWIFNGEYGVFNQILRSLGLMEENITFLGDPKLAMLVIVLATTWRSFPWYMAYILGGLQGVPLDQVEAARIDGAGNVRVLFHIIIPNMKELLSIVLILGAIGALQQFDLIWVMTNGGPAGATTTLAVNVYRSAFSDWNTGRAATIGVIWMVCLCIFMYFYMKRTGESSERGGAERRRRHVAR